MAWMAQKEGPGECEDYLTAFRGASGAACEALRNKKGDPFCVTTLFPWAFTRGSQITGPCL